MLIMDYADGGDLNNYLQKDLQILHGEQNYIFYGEFQ